MNPETKNTETLSLREDSPTVQTLFEELLKNEPKPIQTFVPGNATEQKELFLSGAIATPDHTYPKLAAITFESVQASIAGTAERIQEELEDDPAMQSTYGLFADRYIKTSQLQAVAAEMHNPESVSSKEVLEEEFMKLNVELYGQPDELVYRSLVHDALNSLRIKEFSSSAAEVYSELLELLPRSTQELDAQRFEPSQETIEWAGKVVGALYDDLLSHVPEDKESFGDEEIATVFREIIAVEFADSESGLNGAEGWTVVVEKAQSINVKAADKQLVIPEGRAVSRETLRALIVHEIGVHMLRSVMGGQTETGPLATGLATYYDAEEGMGVVSEQALKQKYVVSGAGHYITAGLAYFDQKSFAETFEIKWRIAALTKLKDGEVLSQEAREKARSLAYNGTMRSFRGTDTLPYFKDLSYYNGAAHIWKYLEDSRGDDMAISLLFMGKANPANPDHRRTLLESTTK